MKAKKAKNLGNPSKEIKASNHEQGPVKLKVPASYSIAAGAGDHSEIYVEGDYSIAASTGDESHASTCLGASVAATTGNNSYSVVRGIIGQGIAAATGNDSGATAIGAFSASGSTGQGSDSLSRGRCAAAVSTNNRGQAEAGNIEAAALTLAYDSKSIVFGVDAVAIALGRDSVARGCLNSWLICSEWKNVENEWTRIGLSTAFVDGEKIKADTWYTLKDGKFVEMPEPATYIQK